MIKPIRAMPNIASATTTIRMRWLFRDNALDEVVGVLELAVDEDVGFVDILTDLRKVGYIVDIIFKRSKF